MEEKNSIEIKDKDINIKEGDESIKKKMQRRKLKIIMLIIIFRVLKK